MALSSVSSNRFRCSIICLEKVVMILLQYDTFFEKIFLLQSDTSLERTNTFLLQSDKSFERKMFLLQSDMF